MARYKAVIEYDGTDFSGFQRQDGVLTVQAAVEEALAAIGWGGSSILAAGRTDAGVHAQGQVIAFDLEWPHAVDDLVSALNTHLAHGVSVRTIEGTGAAFHPRFDALARIYRYSILQDRAPSPLRERYAWRIWPALDLEWMEEATASILGCHDFQAFGSPHKEGGSTEREIHWAEWRRVGELIHFEIEANAFLYHMVRRIVYVLVQIGRGARRPVEVGEMLEHGDANKISGLAPANGLCLVEVIYGPRTVEAGWQEN